MADSFLTRFNAITSAAWTVAATPRAGPTAQRIQALQRGASAFGAGLQMPRMFRKERRRQALEIDAN